MRAKRSAWSDSPQWLRKCYRRPLTNGNHNRSTTNLFGSQPQRNQQFRAFRFQVTGRPPHRTELSLVRFENVGCATGLARSSAATSVS